MTVIHNVRFQKNYKDSIKYLNDIASEYVYRFEWNEFVGPESDYDDLADNPNHWAHKLPGGRWQEKLPHAIYTLYQYVENIQIESVTCVKTNNESPYFADEVTIVLSHDYGIAQIDYSTQQSGKVQETRIFTPNKLLIPRGRHAPTSQADIYIYEIKKFAGAIRNKIQALALQFHDSNGGPSIPPSGHEVQISKFIDSLDGGDVPVSWDEITITNRLVNKIGQILESYR